MGVENRLAGASGLIYTAGETTDASGRAVLGGGVPADPGGPNVLPKIFSARNSQLDLQHFTCQVAHFTSQVKSSSQIL